MPKKVTNEDFINKAKSIHGELYDYSKAQYINNRTKIIIICKTHGEFYQTPNSHTSGSGCATCQGNVLLTTEGFIEKAKKVHGELFDYSKTIYSRSNVNVTIICPIHGEFTQLPNNHLRGAGCTYCSSCYKSTTSKFIEKAKIIHGEKYDYTKVVYVTAILPLIITCPIHGDFEQSANSHLSGAGCMGCAIDKRACLRSLNQDGFLSKAKSIHGDRFNYTKSIYNGFGNHLTIICKKHGEFEQSPHSHFKSGCPKCGAELTAMSLMDTTSGFIEKAERVHGKKYDYSKVRYTGIFNNVIVICEKHGEFEQSPNNHYRGKGCPKCTHKISKAENEIAFFLSGLTTVKQSDRSILDSLELDIVLPDLKVAIEYNGLYWHSERTKSNSYHADKTKECNAAGYRLIHIWEDDYNADPKKVLLWLKSVLNLGTPKKVGGRKTKVVALTSKEARAFQDEYHIQGAGNGSIHLGLVHDEELVSTASYKKISDTEYTLTRYTNTPTLRVIGGYAKLESAFIKAAPGCSTISTFADLSWVNGDSNTYEYHGFKAVSTIPPDYRYVVAGKREHKFGYRHKGMAVKLDIYDPSLTERENMKVNDIERIYDCGKIKYVK